MSVIVAGGGVGGMAAAVRLAEAGVAVTLVETRKKLGGRATSFTDARTGKVLDNCQHVVMGCCTAYLDFLERVGTRDLLAWHREQYWVEAGGRVSTLRPSMLPAPAHFGPSMLAAPFLSMGDVLSLARASRAIMRVDRSEYAGKTFGEFLSEVGQGDRIRRRFWTPVVVSACNMHPDEVSAASALHVFQEGFFANTTASEIGVPSVPLVALYEHVQGIIERAGGRVMLGASVDELDRCTVRLSDGSVLEGERVICALPFERTVRAVSGETREADTRFAPLNDIRHSPILGVHLFFDRPVLELPHCVLVERDTHWLFRKDADGRVVHAVISAADDWMALTEEQIGERVMADIRACLPSAEGATLLECRPVKEKRATFAVVPGIETLRPDVSGPSGILLVGDYTTTGWPATMEGATRSGYAAAAHALGEDPAGAIPAPLPVARVAGWLGLRDAAKQGSGG